MKSIPKPSYGGRPESSPHREKLSPLKVGQFITCADSKEQAAVYAVAKRMGKKVCKRTIKGEKRIYLTSSRLQRKKVSK